MTTFAPNMNYMHQPGYGLGVFCPETSPAQFMPPPGLADYSAQQYYATKSPLEQSYGYETYPLRTPMPRQNDLATLVAAVVGDVIGIEKEAYSLEMNKPFENNADQNHIDYTYNPDENCSPCRAPGWSKGASNKNTISLITSMFPTPDASFTADAVDEKTETGSQTSSENKCCNPGSVGHPDFCSRSCHYFTAGTCSKGEGCQFCHMSHRKRPMRLDKANRSQLRNMSFEERASLILPIMKKKAQAFGLSMEPLAHLEKCIAAEYPIDQVSLDKMRAKSNHKVFRDVLKVGNMNSFVKLLTDADMIALSPNIAAALDQACVVWKAKCGSLEDIA